MKRSPLRRSRWTPKPRRKPTNVILADIWRSGLGPCRVCHTEGSVCSGRVQGHHIIEKQALKKRGLHEHLWDTRNRLPVCEHRHEQHTTRYRPIPRELLPESAWEFADEFGLTWWLEKHYPPLTERGVSAPIAQVSDAEVRGSFQASDPRSVSGGTDEEEAA